MPLDSITQAFIDKISDQLTECAGKTLREWRQKFSNLQYEVESRLQKKKRDIKTEMKLDSSSIIEIIRISPNTPSNVFAKNY